MTVKNCAMPASRYMLGGAQFATALVTRKSVCKVWQQVWHFLRQLSVSCQRKTNSLVLRSPCHSCSIPFLGGVHSSLLREHERGHDTIPLHSIHSMRASREAQGAPAAKAAVSLKSTASKRAHRRCTTGRDATRWVRSTAARWTCGRRLWEVPLCLDPRSHADYTTQWCLELMALFLDCAKLTCLTPPKLCREGLDHLAKSLMNLFFGSSILNMNSFCSAVEQSRSSLSTSVNMNSLWKANMVLCCKQPQFMRLHLLVVTKWLMNPMNPQFVQDVFGSEERPPRPRLPPAWGRSKCEADRFGVHRLNAQLWET